MFNIIIPYRISIRSNTLVLCLILFLSITARENTSSGIKYLRHVIDMAGRDVAIPEKVERIGCMTGASYEKAFLLGAGNKVVVKAATCPPWAERTNPIIKGIFSIKDSHNPNMEELYRLNIEVMFYWDDPAYIEKLRDIGIASVIPQSSRIKINSIGDFTEKIKNEVRLYGKIIGGDAEINASAWCTYYDRKVESVCDRINLVPLEQRPKVYYIRGPDALSTLGPEQNITWYGEMAGGCMVVKKSNVTNIAKVSMEQMLEWNPDVIFVGRQYSPELVLKDDRWKPVEAVKKKQVYIIPDGVFFWDSSSEGILLLEFMAKKLYPERFTDINMENEVDEYYNKFYHCNLTKNEIRLLLNGCGPDGKRVNSFNN
jgi:iron complex transport system substrate-binding protein